MNKLTLAVLATTALLAPAAHAGAPRSGDAMAPVLGAYFDIQKALAGDSDKGVRDAARKIEALAAKLPPVDKDLPKSLKAAAAKLAAAKGLDAEREAFKEVSKPLAAWASAGRPAGVYVAYCPMAKASWLQQAKEIANPYYGSKMLTCGKITSGDDAAPALDPAKPVQMKDVKKMPLKMDRHH